MWESLTEDPLGRLSTRKYLLAAMALLVAFFLHVVFSPTAYAADATWRDNNTVTYNNRSFNGPIDIKKDNDPPSTKKGGVYYIATDGTNSPQQKAYVIYFAPGNSPGGASSAQYITYNYGGPGKLTNPSGASSITIDKSGYAAAPSTGTTSCAIEGMGWIICPVTMFLAKGMDYIYSLVDGFLEVRPLATTQDQALYRAWSVMRNIANVAFVIAFFIIVYSQITNIGISNYSIKRMLPRLVISAILVNVSYWICALAVDIFNILGYGIQDLFISMRNSLVGTEGNSWDVVSWESVASFILSGGSIAAAAGIGGYLAVTAITTAAVGGGFIFLFLPILLSVLFVVLMTFLILAARQAIITILIIIAPLAFVAFLLPNTEKWFEKWRSTLFTLLLVFPGFSLIFGGSQLASAVIIQNATSFNVIILGMAVQVAPLFITPLLLKLGGGVLNRFAGVVNNPTKGVFDRGKTWAKERGDHATARGSARLARMSADGTLGRGGRANPRRMAYRRYHRRQVLEGEKAAYESLAKGRFAETADAQRIHGISQYAGLRQEAGKNTGEEAWQRRIYSSTALRNLTERSHHAHSMAEVYKADTEKRAEEHWEQFALNDSGVRQIRASTHRSSLRAQEAKEAWDNLVVSLESGKANPTIKAEFGAVEVDINQTSRRIAARALEKAANTTMKNVDFATDLKTSLVLQNIAAGVDPNGIDSAKAAASATINRANSEIIANIKESSDILPGDTAAMARELVAAIGSGNINSARAHIDMLATAANPGIKELRRTLETQEGTIRGNPDMLEVLRHHINGSGDINAGAEDIASWGRDSSNGWRTFSQIRSDANTWSNINAQTFASLKQSTQEEALAVPGAISPAMAYDIFTGPSKASLKPNIRAQILALAQQVDPSLR